jgi:hypothetical protein
LVAQATIVRQPAAEALMLRPLIASFALVSLAACSGLVAGPEASNVTPVPASRDSAYVRARRALTTEAFTLDVIDSTGGHITGMRYPSSTAQMGSAAACRVALSLQVKGDAQAAELASTSRWIAPEPMLDKAPAVCEQERTAVLARIAEVVAPPAVQ